MPVFTEYFEETRAKKKLSRLFQAHRPSVENVIPCALISSLSRAVGYLLQVSRRSKISQWKAKHSSFEVSDPAVSASECKHASFTHAPVWRCFGSPQNTQTTQQLEHSRVHPQRPEEHNQQCLRSPSESCNHEYPLLDAGAAQNCLKGSPAAAPRRDTGANLVRLDRA